VWKKFVAPLFSGGGGGGGVGVRIKMNGPFALCKNLFFTSNNVVIKF